MTALTHLHLGALATLTGAAGMVAWRARETRRPLTVRRILGPPLGMSSGLVMFALPAARVPVGWALAAFLAGALVLAYPLQRTSTLTLEGDQIFMRRSRAFFAILLGLLVLRLLLREYLDQLITPPETASLVFLMAFGAILRWRGVMYRDYRRLLQRGPTFG